MSDLVVKQAVSIPPPPKLDFEPLEDYTFDELILHPVEPPRQIIEGMVTEGLTEIAGAQKMGKSWLGLQMCMNVSNGQPFLGRATEQCRTLYLDLESTKSRMTARMEVLQVQQGEYPFMHIVHRASKLSGGSLLKQLDYWMSRLPDTGLILIDTAARVKGNPRRGEDAYQADTNIWGPLQQWALTRHVAVVVLHHFRKQGFSASDDWYERISGSLGLTGVCDCVMALDRKRDEDTAWLKYSPRDFEEGELSIRYNAGRWELLSNDGRELREKAEYERNPIVRAVRDMLKDSQSVQFRSAEGFRDAIRDRAGRTVTQAEIDAIKDQIEQRDSIIITKVAWSNPTYRRIVIERKRG